jgi:hypothetical protein
VLSERLDRLAILKGDVVEGLPVTAWATNLEEVDRDLLLRAAIEAVRKLVVPEWADRRPDDRRPHEALEATEAWLETKSADALLNTKTVAKACTAARNETFGTLHHIVDAARACAWAAGAKDNTHIWEVFAAIERELLGRIALVSEYHKAPEQRRAILDVLRRVLIPPVEAPPPSNDPVPYSASGNFTVGQKLVHAKFGDLVVTAAGDKWIDVQLPDGTTKRLAQKPK